MDRNRKVFVFKRNYLMYKIQLTPDIVIALLYKIKIQNVKLIFYKTRKMLYIDYTISIRRSIFKSFIIIKTFTF